MGGASQVVEEFSCGGLNESSEGSATSEQTGMGSISASERILGARIEYVRFLVRKTSPTLLKTRTSWRSMELC